MTADGKGSGDAATDRRRRGAALCDRRTRWRHAGRHPRGDGHEQEPALPLLPGRQGRTVLTVAAVRSGSGSRRSTATPVRVDVVGCMGPVGRGGHRAVPRAGSQLSASRIDESGRIHGRRGGGHRPFCSRTGRDILQRGIEQMQSAGKVRARRRPDAGRRCTVIRDSGRRSALAHDRKHRALGVELGDGDLLSALRVAAAPVYAADS